MSSMLPDMPAAGLVQSNPALQLQRNPMLPQSPLGAFQDSQYTAQNAMLRADIAKKYQDVLQQLGYVDPDTGQFIMGSVESEANRQKAEYNRQIGLADENVTQQHQNLGTLFSGLRGTDQARAEQPFITGISQLDTDTPMTLSKLYEQGAGLMDEYTRQNNLQLSDAAARAAAGIRAAPPSDTPPTVDTTPTTDDTLPPPANPGAINFGAPQDTGFGGNLGPYIGTLPQPHTALQPFGPAPVAKKLPTKPLSGYAQGSTSNLH